MEIGRGAGIPAEWIGMALGALIAVPAAFATRLGGHLWLTFGGFIAHRTSTLLTERRLRDLRDDPEGGQFAVVLRLKREVVYGLDEGLLAFEGGWLVYFGRQCSFSVRREDVFGLDMASKRHGFVFAGPFGRHVAFFEAADERRLGAAFRAWWRADYVAGAAVYPPVLPNRQIRTVHHSWEALGFLAFAVLLADASMQSKFHDRAFISAFGFVALLVGAFYGNQARFALERIAARLPYRRNRFVRVLGIRPPRRPDARLRSVGVKSVADSTSTKPQAWVEEAEDRRPLARTMLDTLGDGALPTKDKALDAGHQDAKTPQ